jgi:hypothetical protein
MVTVSGIRETILKPRAVRKVVSYYFHHITDCYVISHPKCGRTWLRMMLAKALALHFNDTREIIFDPLDVVRTGRHKGPLIRFIHDGSDRPPDRRKSVSRNRYKRFKGKKVIFLVRDPRDVVVSSYFQYTRRGDLELDLREFVRDPWWGVVRIIEFMKGWYENRNLPADFYLVRYEDLHLDATGELGKVVDFLGLEEVTEEIITLSTKYSSFENMRKMSQNELNDNPIFAAKDPKDPESFKVRRGEVEGYKQYLSRDDIEYIEERMKSRLPSYFGYHDYRLS